MATAVQRPGYNLAVKFGADGRNATIPYLVSGCVNINEGFEVALSQATADNPVIMGMTPSGLTLVEELRTAPSGLLDYEISVDYSDGAKEKVEGDEETTFDTTGGSEKITQSLGTVRYGLSGANDPLVPNFHGAINVTDSGVEGVEQPAPKLEFTITKYWNSTFLTDEYLKILAYATGKMNLNAFRGFAPGEVLFLGASGSQTGNKPWKIQYKFAVSSNATDIEIPTPSGTITVSEKYGWDYLWLRYALDEDTPAKSVVRVPQGVYVERTKTAIPFVEFQLSE